MYFSNSPPCLSRNQRSNPLTCTPIALYTPIRPYGRNILRFQVGDAIYETNQLDTFFFTELQGRFGNKFNVRDNGEDSAITAATDALIQCLRTPGGCRSVPGISEEQLGACIACSVAGGVVLGFSTKATDLGKFGFLWFTPVWGILFVSFGLGPIVTRTQDLAPVGYSTGAFLAAAAAVVFAGRILGVRGQAQGGGAGGSQ